VEVISTVARWRKTLDAERAAGRSVGLVPTMGYLHAGHGALIERAGAECDTVAVTVFVNPLQFGPAEDLAAYPRDLEADVVFAGSCGAAFVFAPPVEEMYRAGAQTTVHVAGVSAGFEGASRPGHFDGVATVVAKLFAQAGPCRAYFGEKDFQQLAVIRQLAVDLDLPVEVVGCPTVREADGLALSSRNVYLTPAERAIAPVLHRALEAGVDAARRERPTADAVRSAMTAVLAGASGVTVEYADVVDAHTLLPATEVIGDLRLLIAARLGRARLIDNMGVTV
jgi:pantoate--beta-alanine ligase